MGKIKSWQDALSALGVLIEPVGPTDLKLTFQDVSREAYLMVLPYILTPSRAQKLPAGPGLVVVTRASPAAVAEAARSEWAVVTPSGNVDLRGLGIDLVAEAEQEDRQAHVGPRLVQGPVPWGSLLAVRRLLAAKAPVTQLQLAELTALSQPQVHRALKPLLEHGLVERYPRGFAVTHLSATIDWWLERYPGPRGVRSYWTSLDSPIEQAAHLVTEAKRAEQHSDPGAELIEPLQLSRTALSGDAAADLIAPWRRPAQVVVYAERPYPPRLVGLVPAASAENATLVLVSPQDPGVWLPCQWPGVKLPIADPLQVLYDLQHAPGADSRDAAANWRDVLVHRLRPAWSTAAGYDR